MMFIRSLRVTWIQSIHAIIHLAIVVILTFRSVEISSNLNPYERSLANEWIRLLYYVDTLQIIPNTLNPMEPSIENPITLPHFLLETEEEIAANVDNEFFDAGFNVRASSYPVGLLFTVNETRLHVHGAIENYYKLRDTALCRFAIANADTFYTEKQYEAIAYPELTIRSYNGTEAKESVYILRSPRNEAEWPEPLRLHSSDDANTTRSFFDSLGGMEIKFSIGLIDTLDTSQVPPPMLLWWVAFSYDLSSQAHFTVSMNHGFQLKNASTGEILDNIPPSLLVPDNSIYDPILIILLLLRPTISWLDSRRERRDIWFYIHIGLDVSTLMTLFVLATQASFFVLALPTKEMLALSLAIMCTFQWLSLLLYVKLHSRFRMLASTLQRGVPKILQFLLGVAPIFIGYVLFGTIMFGTQIPRFSSPSTTATTLFSIANGDSILDTFNALAYTPWIGQLYLYSYLFLFSYVVLMVCIGIIEDAFFGAVFPAFWPKNEQEDKTQERENI